MKLIHIGNPIQTVSPDQATIWIENNLYARQRALREHRVQELAHLMSRGMFLEGSSITFGILNNRLHLVNGQHTLNAIVRFGQPVELNVQYYTVADEDELATLYTTQDCQLPRSARDNILAHDLPTKFNLNTSNISKFRSGVNMIANEFESGSSRYKAAPGSRSFSIGRENMEDWLPEAQIYFNEILIGDVPQANYHSFRNATVVAVALLTLRHQPVVAREFWRGAVMDDGLRTGDPRRTLLMHLRDKRKRSSNEDARCIATAWNAYFRGDTAQVLRLGSVNDLKVLGTQHILRNSSKTAAKVAKKAKPTSKTAEVTVETCEKKLGRALRKNAATARDEIFNI